MLKIRTKRINDLSEIDELMGKEEEAPFRLIHITVSPWVLVALFLGIPLVLAFALLYAGWWFDILPPLPSSR